MSFHIPIDHEKPFLIMCNKWNNSKIFPVLHGKTVFCNGSSFSTPFQTFKGVEQNIGAVFTPYDTNWSNVIEILRLEVS